MVEALERLDHLLKLPGLDRKIRVATDWTLDLFLKPDIVQLKTDRDPGVRREYFEPGQVVLADCQPCRAYLATCRKTTRITASAMDAGTPTKGPGFHPA